MKRKITIMICVICCLGLVACGEKEEQNNDVVEKEVAAVEDKPAEDNTEADKENESESSLPEVEASDEVISEATGEVIGDIDIPADGLTMEGMSEQVIGLDIPVYVAEDGSNVGYDGKNFTLLFPSPMYVTEYTDTGVRAQTEAVDFVLSVMSNFSDAPESVNETRNEVKEVIGNYVIVSRLAKNTDNAFIKTYNIYNTVDGTSIQMTLTINKDDEYLDYDNALIEQYIPALEESIKNNLQ